MLILHFPYGVPGTPTTPAHDAHTPKPLANTHYGGPGGLQLYPLKSDAFLRKAAAIHLPRKGVVPSHGPGGRWFILLHSMCKSPRHNNWRSTEHKETNNANPPGSLTTLTNTTT